MPNKKENQIFLDDRHVLIDIETTGTKVGSAIVSIGAVKFNKNGIYDRFKAEISVESCFDHNLDYVEEDTMEWTEDQEAEFTVDGDPLPEVLTRFNKWLPGGSYYVWAKSPSFDCRLLKEAYAQCGIEAPWNFWEQRDVRTANNFYMLATGNSAPEPNIEGTPHEPLHDAEVEALQVLISIRGIRDVMDR